MDLPYGTKFENIPDIEVDTLIEYFNLEFGVAGSSDVFKESDFKYLGVFIKEGMEAMYWSVNNCKVHAVVRPFEDSYIIEMGDGP